MTLLLSWPLPARIFTHVPGVAQWAFDESTFLWNIWYFKHALIDNLSNPLHSELIYYPLGIDLVLYTYNVFNALIAQPLHVAVSLVFASNVTVLLSTILSGYGTFLLVRWLLIGYRRSAISDSETLESSRQSPVASRPAPRSLGHLVTLSAIVAGLLYAFASNRAVYATLGHYDMVTTQWIPFYALTLLQSLDRTRTGVQRRKSAVLAGVFFAFNGLAEMIIAVFLAIFTIIVVAVYLWQVAGGSSRQAAIHNTQYAIRNTSHAPRTTRYSLLITSLLITGLVAFLLWSPILVPILVQFLTDDFSLRGWGEAIPLSTDLLGWFTPTVLHPIFGGDLVQTLRTVLVNWTLPGDQATGFRDVNTVFIGWVSGALALLGALIYRRRVAIWIWTALIFGVFTLGPFLQINGRYRFDLDGVETSFPLPYALLHYIPIVKANRAPNRNSVLLMLGIAVLVGYAVYWLISWLSRQRKTMDDGPWTTVRRLVASSPHRLIASVVALAILFEHLALPLPLSDARVPGVYEIIATDPAPVSVMHAPLGWRNSFGVFGAERTRLQYFQSVHQKPMIGGNISRAPDFKMDYFRRIPLFQAIADVETGRELSPDLATLAAEQAPDLMYLYNVGYVLLMPPIEQRFPYADTWQRTWDFYQDVLPLEPQPFWAQDGIEAYRVNQPEGADHFSLTLGEPGTFPYRAEGWDVAEVDAPYGQPASWATAEESCLFIPLRSVDASAAYRITVQVHPFDYPGSPEQTAALIMNGELVSAQELANDWQAAAWTVPGEALRNTINEVCLAWGYTAVPRQVLGGNRQIGATGVELPIDADLRAFADGAWIALFDKMGEPIDASAGRRGVNVTVLEPESGEVLEMHGFDTAANQFESEKLAAFLRQIPDGRPVLVASRGDAGAFLTEDSVVQLRSIGADVSLDQLRGNAFAFVGVKGAAPGTAVQSVEAGEAFVQISLNRDRRTLAAAVGQVEISKQ